MPRPAATQPTEVELQILRVLWERGSCTARQIHDVRTEQKDTNYSTTVKMLSVMLEKGLLKRDEAARPHVYRPAASRQATQRRMLRDLIRNAYAGSAGSLVLQALSSQRASPEEVAAIRRLLDEMEGK
jgi:BlaI family transcriptional regulator, penicillinase repressor